ncbi:MAG: hypothetical protein FWE41_04360 [Coriobacteriia bacterium]|nr:hypothetical protein [Coriobacteriia bacterium]
MFQFDQGQIGTLTPSPCSNLVHQPRPSCTKPTPSLCTTPREVKRSMPRMACLESCNIWA